MILSAINRNRHSRVEGGFTLVELLVVILILAILIGLLVPAIYGALRTARKAAVSAEINQIATALNSFKSKYGDFPPSRFLCDESGNYAQWIQSTSPLGGPSSTAPSVAGFYDPSSPGTNDITLGVLAQRSASALRRFWPRVSTTSAPTGQFYDFNGNGVNDSVNGLGHPYILHGHECLVLFLGGIPVQDSNGNFGVSGFSKDPTNPFSSIISAYGTNRTPAMFEFVPSRLFADPNSPTGVPGYYDNFGGAPGGASSLNFYAYFSAYTSNGYDPNDVNFTELDANNSGPIGLGFSVTFPTYGGATTTSTVAGSYAPNPYTSTLTESLTVNANGPPVVTYLNAQTFQIISSGIDGLYGVGGQYVPSSSSTAASANPLPLDTTSTAPYINTTDHTVQQREQDNLTNFKTSSLQ